MDLSKIANISGKPGLFSVVSQGKNNVLVESLLDGKRFPIFAHHHVSILEEISVYTHSEDRPLKDIFKAINQSLGEVLDFDPKEISSDELKAKFTIAVPDYNKEAVYVSDIKKIFGWYKLLSEKQLLDFTEEGTEVEEPGLEEAASE